MSFDSRAFRHALGCYPTGVAVVIAGTGKVLTGITVSSFAPVSLDPPLVLWCMDRKSSRYRTFTTVENFTVIGRVMRFAWRKTGAPLVFFRGRYGAVAETGAARRAPSR